MGQKQVGIYVRVSLDRGQDVAMQETELLTYTKRREWKAKIYRDQGHSGAKESRPGLDALLADVRRGDVDIVAVWSLDRLARSVKQLLDLAEEFKALNVDFIALKQNIDTSTPAGRLTYLVLSGVAEFERELLRERVRSGIAQARRAGKRIGRPALRVLTAEQIAKLRRERLRTKAPFRKLATKWGLSVWTVYQLCSHKKS